MTATATTPDIDALKTRLDATWMDGNWTKDGFIGKMFKTFARFIAPPGMPAPVLGETRPSCVSGLAWGCLTCSQRASASMVDGATLMANRNENTKEDVR